MHKRVIVTITFLVIGLAMAAPGLAAPQFQHTRSVITYPESDTTVSGIVEIRGIATHSSAQWWYDVSYAPGPGPTEGSQWVPLAQVENTPVQNDVLAVWDTTSIPDGVYTLVLTVKGEGDPTYWQFFVRNLTVNNTDFVVTPTSVPATPLPMPTAAAGPTPTPVLIEQPPTPTPQQSPTPEGGEEDEGFEPPSDEEGDGLNLALDTEGLRSAFCTGGLITLMLFVLWGLYMLAKASVRWYLRRSTAPPPGGGSGLPGRSAHDT